MADGAVGADPVDDPRVPNGRSCSRLATGALFPVGYLRGLFEFRRVDAQPIEIMKKRWAMPISFFARSSTVGK